MNSASQHARSRAVLDDNWVINGDDAVWLRAHNGDRRSLVTSSRLEDGPTQTRHFSSIRLTCVAFDNSVKFSHVDRWKNRDHAHRELKRPWTGSASFFEHDCSDLNATIFLICSVNDASMKAKVCFNESAITYHDIVPYSELYDVHPHFLLACRNGFKLLPHRADYLIGKSANVMNVRRESLKCLRARNFRKRRRQMIPSS